MSKRLLTKALAGLLLVAVVVPASFLVMPQRVVAADASCAAGIVAGVVAYLFGKDVPALDKFNLSVNTNTSVSSYFSCVYTTVIVPMLKQMIRNILKQMTASVVSWINGGGGNTSGSPSYVQNLSVTLRGVGDAAGLAFISQFGTALASSPFATSIQSALSSAYAEGTSLAGFFAANQCTLVTATRTIADVNAFLAGNWSRGGTAAWLSLTTQAQNNPYTLYQAAQSQLRSNVAQVQMNRRQDLIQSGGFMSWCPEGTSSGKKAGGVACFASSECTSGVCQADSSGSGSGVCTGGANPKSQCANPDGTPAQASTPGSVIMSYAQANINSGIGQLVSAQDLDDALGAIAGALLNQVIGPTGLFGSTQSSGSNSSGSSPTSTTLPASYSSAGATASAVLSGITTYTTAANKLSAAAGQASQRLTDLMTMCTAAATAPGVDASFAATARAQAAAAQTALENSAAPLLLNMQNAVAAVSATTAFATKVQTAAANPATDPVVLATDLATLLGMPPTSVDITRIQDAATHSGGATALPRNSEGGATVTLNVSGGSPMDQMTLLTLNASILQSVCVPPTANNSSQGGQ